MIKTIITKEKEESKVSKISSTLLYVIFLKVVSLLTYEKWNTYSGICIKFDVTFIIASPKNI